MDLFSNEKFSDAYLIIIDRNNQTDPFPIHRQILAAKSQFFSNIFDMPGITPLHNGKPLFTVDISSISTAEKALAILELFYQNLKEINNFHCSALFYDSNLLEYFNVPVDKIYHYNLTDLRLQFTANLGFTSKILNFKGEFDNPDKPSDPKLKMEMDILTISTGIFSHFVFKIDKNPYIILNFMIYIDPLNDYPLQKYGDNHVILIFNQEIYKRIIDVFIARDVLTENSIQVLRDSNLIM